MKTKRLKRWMIAAAALGLCTAVANADTYTLESDEDWSGRAEPFPEKVNLNGHKLTVSRLSDTCEITDASFTEQYDLLEYIDSNGSQYILTGVDASTTLEAHGKFRILTYVENAAIFGPAMYDLYSYLLVMQGNTFKHFGSGSAVWSTWATAPTDTDFEFSMVNGTFTMTDGTTTKPTTVNTSISKVPAAGKQIALFACNYSAKHQSSIRAYSFKFVENGTVLRNLVPARRVSDNKVGLLDLANPGLNEFYVDAAGGNFTAGPTTGAIDPSAKGELYVKVASGETVENTLVTLSGSLKLIKDGEGTLTASKSGQTYAGGTEVKGGKLTVSSGSESVSKFLGAANTEVTVGDGATFELNGNTTMNVHPLVLAGGTLQNSVGAAKIGSVTLTANSTMLQPVKSTTSIHISVGGLVDLGGFKLTVTNPVGTYFYLADGGSFVDGAVSVNGEGYFQTDGAAKDMQTTDFEMHDALQLNADISVHDWTVTTTYASSLSKGNKYVNIYGAYTPTADHCYHFKMQDGSSLNLSGKNAAWNLPDNALAFADDATILINVGERELKTNDKVVAWSTKPANVAKITFKFIGNDPDGKSVNAVVQDDGLYYPDVTTIVKATWIGAADGDISNPSNWSCENAFEQVVIGALPGASTVVHLNGEIAFNIPSGTSFKAGSVNANVSLKGDCDWSGLGSSVSSVPITGVIDLNGHNLTVAQLAGDCEITDSTHMEQYELLEYIDSNGNQYILTGVDASATLEAYGKFRILKYVENTAIFGSGVYADKAYLFVMQGNTFKYYGGGGAVWPTTWTAATVPTDDFEFSMVNGVFTMTDGRTTPESTTVNISIANIPSNNKQVSLFTSNGSNNRFPSSIRAYSFKFAEGGTVLRDFVPAKRVSDGAVGLLDLAHLGTDSEFYANKGTGTFAAGATTGYILTKPGCSEGATPSELHINVASGTIKNTVKFSGSLKAVKEGEGTLELGTVKQSNAGGWEIAEGTVKASGNLHDYTSFGQEGTTVTVREGATYDQNGQYDSRYYSFVLDGGTIANTGGNLAASGGSMGPITLTKNSYFDVTSSFPLWGKVDLGGFTLTVNIANNKYLYLYKNESSVGGIFENGTVIVTGGGTFQPDAVTGNLRDMRTVDFKLDASLALTTSIDVRNLTMDYDGTKNSGSGVVNIYGIFAPSANNYLNNFVLQDGSTLNLTGRNGTYDLSSALTGKTLTFAEDATINIVPGNKCVGKIISWTETTKPAEGIKFAMDKQYGKLEVKSDGLYLHRGLVFIFQ